MEIDSKILSSSDKSNIIKDLVVYIKSDYALPKKYKIYKQSLDHYNLPFVWAINNLSYFPPPIFEDNRIKIKTPKIELRPLQKKCIDECSKEFIKPYGGGIINLQTGGGKTICSLYLIGKYKMKTLIIVNTVELMNQWIDSIKKFLPDVKIGKIQGNTFDTKNKDIVIGMVQTISMRKEYTKEKFSEFGITFIDECFPYDTNIDTVDGNICMGKLYYMRERGEKLPNVKTFNEDTRRFEYKNIVNVFRKQNDNLIELQFGKMKIKSTENHRYLTNNGWIECKNLKIGDYILGSYDKIFDTVCPALNADQYQIILGSFLGDGHIQQLKSGKYRMSVIHCEKQHDYCKWKAKMFNVDDVRHIEKNGYAQKVAYAFSTKTFHLFNKIPSTKSNVPQWVLDDLDERGLSIWFMDDGNLHKKCFSSTISTDSFDENSQKRIVIKLQSMGIDCKYTLYKKSYYHIVINEKGTKELIRIISKYIHTSMLYKLLTRQYTSYIKDQSIHTLDENTIFCSRENIKMEFLIENGVYKIYKNYDKKDSEICSVKYLFCKKCDNTTFHSRGVCHDKYEYWTCRHKKKDVLENMPLIFGNYEWDNNFLDYGYSKVTKISNIINFNKSKFKRNYVFDLEIEDNHNYIVKNNTPGNKKTGVVAHNCHHLSSEVFSETLFKTRTKYTFGLSATVERKDKLEYVFKWHIGDILFSDANDTKKQKTEFMKLDYKGKSSIEKTMYNGKPKISTMITNISEDIERTKMICDYLKLLPDTRRVLVLGDRVDQLNVMYKMLGDKISGLFTGKTPEEEKQSSRKKKIMLATYQIASEGFNHPDLNTLLFATPRSNVIQATGRIYRKIHDVTPLIIDVVDWFSVFPYQYKKRKAIYDKYIDCRIQEDECLFD